MKGGIYMAHYYIDPYSGKKKRNTYHRNKKAKQKLQNLYNIGADHWYPWPVTWSNYEYDIETHRNYKAPNAFLIRNYRGKRSKYLKTIGHKLTRRRKNSIEVSNTTYNKHFDFWWELD